MRPRPTRRHARIQMACCVSHGPLGRTAESATSPMALGTLTRVNRRACNAGTQRQLRWQPSLASPWPRCSFSVGAACTSHASACAKWPIEPCWRFARRSNRCSLSTRREAPAAKHARTHSSPSWPFSCLHCVDRDSRRECLQGRDASIRLFIAQSL